jgi:hypothetical protein
LNSTDQKTGGEIGRRIVDDISAHPIAVRGANPLSVNVTFSCISIPPDWRSLRDSLSAARVQLSTEPAPREGSRSLLKNARSTSIGAR